MPRQEVKTQAYNQYVRPTLQYAASAWYPHTRKNIDKLEQRYAAIYVASNFSCTASVNKILKDLSGHHCNNDVSKAD